MTNNNKQQLLTESIERLSEKIKSNEKEMDLLETKIRNLQKQKALIKEKTRKQKTTLSGLKASLSTISKKVENQPTAKSLKDKLLGR